MLPGVDERVTGAGEERPVRSREAEAKREEESGRGCKRRDQTDLAPEARQASEAATVPGGRDEGSQLLPLSMTTVLAAPVALSFSLRHSGMRGDGVTRGETAPTTGGQALALTLTLTHTTVRQTTKALSPRVSVCASEGSEGRLQLLPATAAGEGRARGASTPQPTLSFRLLLLLCCSCALPHSLALTIFLSRRRPAASSLDSQAARVYRRRKGD